MRKRTARTYDASKRRAHAALSTKRILAAAAALFSSKGIDAVTVAQVAARARVSTASIYTQFRSKAGLLEALTHSVLLGEKYQADARGVEGVTDPKELLRATAAIARGVYEREHKEMGLIRGAAAYSPALKDMETRLEATRRELQKERASLVFKSTPALKSMGLAKVRDVMWGLTGRDLYRMLVLERGWSPQAYERWLAATLIQTLLQEGS